MYIVRVLGWDLEFIVFCKEDVRHATNDETQAPQPIIIYSSTKSVFNITTQINRNNCFRFDLHAFSIIRLEGSFKNAWAFLTIISIFPSIFSSPAHRSPGNSWQDFCDAKEKKFYSQHLTKSHQTTVKLSLSVFPGRKASLKVNLRRSNTNVDDEKTSMDYSARTSLINRRLWSSSISWIEQWSQMQSFQGREAIACSAVKGVCQGGL